MKLQVGRIEHGFTVIELLVVIVILGLIASLVGPHILHVLENARVLLAKQQIANIETSLDLYKVDVGSYPSTGQGLQALTVRPADVDKWNGPYVKSRNAIQDPWSHPWRYYSPSSRVDHDYDICSDGGRNVEPGKQAPRGSEICNP